MSKKNFYQFKVENIQAEMDRGTGSSSVYPYPIELEPPFKKFSHYVEPPKSWLVKFFSKQNSQKFEPQKITPPADLGFIAVKPSADEKLNIPQFEQLIGSLKFDYPLSFEIIADKDRIILQLTVKKDDMPIIINIIRSQFPAAEVFEQTDFLKEAAEGRKITVSAYGLKESHFFPLTIPKLDSLKTLLSNLSTINNSEVAALQVFFQPTKNNWAANMQTACRGELEPTKSVFNDLPELPKLVSQKVSKQLFAVQVRLITTSTDLTTRLESFFNQFGNEYNGFIRLTGDYPAQAAISRAVHATGIILNSEELAGCFIHLPDASIAIPKLEKAKKAVCPPQTTDDEKINLGSCHYQGKFLPVAVSFEWLSRHASIFGGTGAGKTNLLSFLFSQLIEKSGVGFIDPNGDACLEFLSLIPKEKIGKVIYFDPINYPLAINPLYINDPSQIELTTVNLLTAIKRLFDASSWGPRLEYILRKTIKTLILSGNKTLLDVPLLLTDKNYRNKVLTGITDPDLLSFWQNTFTKLPSNAMFSILNKLSILLDSDVIKPILSNPQPDIDFNDILNNQKIFIANLSKGTLGMNAHVLGSFILSAFQMATMARAKISKPQRKFFTLIIDEFHNYADSSNVTSINSLLSEARKYRVALITATQFLTQIDKRIRDAVFGNVGSLISLRVGIDDAHVLQKELGQFTDEDLLNLRVGEAIVRMGMAKDSFGLQIPLVESSTDDYTREILKLAKLKKTAISSTSTLVSPQVAITIPTLAATSNPAPKTTPAKPVLQPTTPKPSALQNNTTNDSLSADEQQLLELIYRQTELLPIGKLGQKTSFGMKKNYKLVNQLNQKGLLIQKELRITTSGRKANIPVITQKAITALKYPSPVGKGGALHQQCQRIVKTYAEQQGYTAIIEKQLNNQESVDVSLEKANQKIAVEISITTDAADEMNNIEKCLKAGYAQVNVICADVKTMENLKKSIKQKILPQNQPKIVVSPLGNLLNDLNLTK